MNSEKVLITGMPFSGKTYISSYFIKNGINAVDSDSISGLGSWFDHDGKATYFYKEAGIEWLERHRYLWNLDFLKSWLNIQQTPIYFFGVAENVWESVSLFDRLYYLDLTRFELLNRFILNERENPMGETKEQQKSLINDLMPFRKKAIEKGFTFISANLDPKILFEHIRT